MNSAEIEIQQACQQQLESKGVPTYLAIQCAGIVAKDDPTKENLGRSREEQHLIQSAHAWMTAHAQE